METGIDAGPTPSRTHRQRWAAWFWRPGDRRWYLNVRWRSIALASLIGACAVYLAGATAGFAFVRYHRGVAALRWTDCAFPWRWPDYRVKRGEHLIALAERSGAEGRFREAFVFARAGLAASPANRAGRLLLAELEDSWGREQDGRWTLVDGLPHHYRDADYVRLVLDRLLREQKDAFVAMLAERYRPRLPAGAAAARVFAFGAARASHLRGHYDRAEDLLRQLPPLAESRDGRLLRAEIEWERGYRDLALVRLRQLADEMPDDAEIHAELVNDLRGRGLADEARRRSLTFQIAHPALAWPRIEVMRAYHESGDARNLAREVHGFIEDFGREQRALLALGDFAAGIGDAPLAGRVLEHALGRRWRREPFLFLATEAKIAAGDYAAAWQDLVSWRSERAEWERHYPALFESLQAVAAFGSGDTAAGRANLAGLLARENLRAANLLAVANRLVALDAVDEAAQVLAKALVRDPNNQAALTRLVELEIVLNRGDALAQHVVQLLKMRRPSPDLLRVAQLKLGSDLFLFSRQVPAALAAVGEFMEAGVLRRAKPWPSPE